jgi:hypothetical protein
MRVFNGESPDPDDSIDSNPFPQRLFSHVPNKMTFKHLLLLSIPLVLGRFATAAEGPVGKNHTFYVWGNGIPGLQLFYDNGQSDLHSVDG